MKIIWWITIPSVVFLIIAAVLFTIGDHMDVVFTVGGIIAFIFFLMFVAGLIVGIVALIGCITNPGETTVDEVMSAIGLTFFCGLVVWFFIRVCLMK